MIPLIYTRHFGVIMEYIAAVCSNPVFSVN